MNIDEAKSKVGLLVMSADPGAKLIRRVKYPHGPYRLLKITKAGMAVLEGREDFRVCPSVLTEFKR